MDKGYEKKSEEVRFLIKFSVSRLPAMNKKVFLRKFGSYFFIFQKKKEEKNALKNLGFLVINE